MRCSHIWAAASFAALLAFVPSVSAQQAAQPTGGAQDHVAVLKQSLQDGKALIREYEWIETTIISLKGEEKARKQNRCYYGADGKVQKVPVGDAAPSQQSAGPGGGGRRGGRMKEKIVEKKKDEMQDYMERAVTLVHMYVPPDPAKIQAAKDAGRVTADPQPGGRVHVAILQYQKPGDSLTVDLDAAANRLVGVGVSSYLDTPDDPVMLEVQMSALPDGAIYAAQTTLDAKAKNIRVVVQNSGHRPVAR